MEADQILDGLNDEQRRAVTSTTVPLCILAGAGSGKTRVLTRRIAHRALTGDHDPRHVLALTFTRKAAGELTNRLRRLGLRDTVAAGTFHSVAYAQLRARWNDRGIAPPELLVQPPAGDAQPARTSGSSRLPRPPDVSSTNWGRGSSRRTRSSSAAPSLGPRRSSSSPAP